MGNRTDEGIRRMRAMGRRLPYVDAGELQELRAGLEVFCKAFEDLEGAMGPKEKDCPCRLCSILGKVNRWGRGGAGG